jgi:arylsulfatase A-like enzyme
MSNSATRPNVILILVDDMGYSDISPYGSEINTPNLSRLAQSGVRFSQFYNCARCCPTRASLLTGLYPHQAGVGHMVNDRGVGPAFQGYLRDDCLTIAESLRASGYRTWMSGKWHVGGHYAPDDPDSWRPGEPGHPIPVQRGFDEHYGMLGGAGSYFNPPTMVRNDQLIVEGGEGYYLTDAISDYAVEMIEKQTAADTSQNDDASTPPMFGYVAYTAPHWPLHAFPEDIERYRGKYRGGWDALRTSRHEELNASGLLDPVWDISPRDVDAPAWTDTEHTEWEDLRMAVYAAQIECMDRGVGRIMDALRESGQEDNTVVLFLSDNGGCAEFLAEDDEPAQPSRFQVPTRDGRSIRVGNTPSIDPGPDDTFTSYDLPWANASNTPFRLYKHWVHEGGISTPFIAQLPEAYRTTDMPSIIHDPCHVIDVLPTILELAGAKHPSEGAYGPVQPLEGTSLLPRMTGRTLGRGAPIFWDHEGNRAVRSDGWKLVSRYPDTWELYNMEHDRTELHNLAESERGRVASMAREYEAWAGRIGVIPWPA